MRTHTRAARGLLDLLALTAAVLLLWQGSAAIDPALRALVLAAIAIILGAVVYLWIRIGRTTK